MPDNANLARAHANKNDEYYTRYVDVEAELPLYKEYLKGKKIYCNCDNPETSNIYKYLKDHFAEFGLSTLTSTYYSESKLPEERPRKTVYDGINTIVTVLSGNGSFDSEESVKTLNQSDILITNPPFSKYADFFRTVMTSVIDYGLDFLMIGTLNVCVKKDVFPYIKEGKIRIGYHQLQYFTDPMGERKRVANTVWMTTLPVAPKSYLELTKTYNPDDYQTYDDFDCIEVSRLHDIPKDYDGLMGVPISFLMKHNSEQFEIVGDLNHDTNSPYNLGKAYVNGIQKFTRIVIKRV